MDDNILNLRNNTEIAKEFFAQKLAFYVGPTELKTLLEEGSGVIVDARLKSDYEVGHIPDAKSFAYNDIEDKEKYILENFKKEDLHIIYGCGCHCNMATKTAYLFAKNNYSVVILEGGFKLWAEGYHFAVVQ